MAKPKGEKKGSPPVPEVQAIERKLHDCEEENESLTKELAETKDAAAADAHLLALGLRLAMANEALKVEIAGLQDQTRGETDEKTTNGGTGTPE